MHAFGCLLSSFLVDPVSQASDAAQRGTLVKVSSKVSNDEIVKLSFKVPTQFRKRFKLSANGTRVVLGS